ncbi:uracil-DNA glycosylase [Knoellia flava TL1]|uniref:Type-4 uracil-DNA glycosylase n=2 Tax=Knoellia flava TaxID=913969 RepID=A0A8H9FUA5_9MICO|nr:uracil-DNA glycosylase [Knoellia flava TL1]GGB83110.1 uracil-DNA glycosylase [Knoellia flava]
MSAADGRARPGDWPGASEWVPRGRSVAALADAAQRCRGCDLFRDTTQAVMGSGPADAELVLVGEQPGDREDVEGEPFVGPAGRLLDAALTEAGLDPSAVYRTNVVKHFRHTDRGGKRIHKSPARWQVAKCEPWLLAELDRVRPRGAVLLGATAGQEAFGATFRVGESRGRWLPWPQAWPAHRGEFTLATPHPASVLRSRRRDEDLAALVADLRVAAELLT